MAKHKFVGLFLLCCALPLLAAQLVLHFGWFNSGVGSKGTWQQQEVFVLPATTDKAHWRIAVIPAGQCDQLCQNALYTVQQLYIGLGRKQDQVKPLLLSELPLTQPKAFITQSTAPLNMTAQLKNQIALVDYQGLVLLRYPMPANEQEMVQTAKAVRQDLLKLLNYDRTSA